MAFSSKCDICGSTQGLMYTRDTYEHFYGEYWEGFALWRWRHRPNLYCDGCRIKRVPQYVENMLYNIWKELKEIA